jgi:PEP-CTERM motif
MRLKLVVAAVVAALSVTSACAEILRFSFTGDSGDFATWTQPSDPTPVGFQDQFYTEVEVANGASSGGGFTIVEFDSNAIVDGGFFIDQAGLFGAGPTLYSGPESAPIFHTGRFLVNTGSVTVTAAVPEPSTWAMMLIGFAGLGYASRRALRKSAALWPS